MNEVSLTRLYVLRATYALIAAGLAAVIWPALLDHSPEWAVRRGDTAGLLAGVSILALLGIRYPLKMLPLLLFEFVWKVVWLLAIGLPLWAAGDATPATMESIKACLMGVVLIPLVVPWPYIYANYLKAPGDRWRRPRA